MLVNGIYFVAQTFENDLIFFLILDGFQGNKLARATQQLNRVRYHLTDLTRPLIAIDLLPRAISFVFAWHLLFCGRWLILY